MSDGFSWIRTLYEHDRGESDRCIKACGLARYEGGLLCRLFERRDA